MNFNVILLIVNNYCKKEFTFHFGTSIPIFGMTDSITFDAKTYFLQFTQRKKEEKNKIEMNVQ